MMKIRWILLWVILLSAVLLPSAHAESEEAKLAEQAIRKLDAEWRKAVKEKNMDKILSFYAEDAHYLPMNGPMVTGKDAIRKIWSDMLSIPDFQENWEIIRLEASGNLAYLEGKYQATFKNEEGKRATEIGKWIQVWKKQSDGSWKTVAEIFNTDSAPTTD